MLFAITRSNVSYSKLQINCGWIISTVEEAVLDKNCRGERKHTSVNATVRAFVSAVLATYDGTSDLYKWHLAHTRPIETGYTIDSLTPKEYRVHTSLSNKFFSTLFSFTRTGPDLSGFTTSFSWLL